jgi:hypothetical protein
MALAIGEEPTATRVPITLLSTAAFENQSIEQKQNHCAYDRHDPTGNVILARKEPADPGADKSPGDSEQMQPPGSFPGINSFAMAPTTRPITKVQRIECALKSI